MNENDELLNALKKIDLLEKKVSSLEEKNSGLEIFKRFFSMSNDLTCIIDTEGKFIEVSDLFCKKLKFPENYVFGRYFSEFIHPDDVKSSTVEFDMNRRGIFTPFFENRYIANDGSVIYLQWSSYFDPVFNYVYAIARDVTEKRISEEKLRKSEQLMQAAISIAKLGSWSFDLQTQTVYWSDELFEIFGTEPLKAELIYPYYLSCLSEIDVNRLNLFVENAVVNKMPYTFQHAVYLKNNEKKWAYCSGVPITNEDGQVIRIEGFIQDISTMKQDQEQISRNEKLLTAAQAIAKLGYWSADPITRDMIWSDEIYKILEIEPSIETDLYQLFKNHLSEENTNRIEGLIENSVTHGEPFYFEHELHFPSGHSKWIIAYGIPVADDEGRIVRFEGISQDITETKRAQLYIIDSIHEKEKLLQELHHRVKNNLQVISSLINLQLVSQDDPITSGALKESQMRISSIAAIHDYVYYKDQFASVVFYEFLPILVNNITYTLKNEFERIESEVLSDPIQLELDKAIPLGLIINEILTTALKNAYRETPEIPQLHVRVHVTDNGEYKVLIQYNSTFNSNSEIEKSIQLSETLIVGLSEQLDAKMSRQIDSNGTRYEFIFS